MVVLHCVISAVLLAISNNMSGAQAFNVMDYSHYLDYLPYRQEGLAAFEDFRTAPAPPTRLRNRKMNAGPLQGLSVEDVLADPVWPKDWPYGPEDFRSFDYTRDEVIPTMAQYQYSQSLLTADHVILIPGILRVPIRRHFILPKDKIGLADHLGQYFFPGARVLELFSTYESILPPQKLGPTVGVGWFNDEMKCNPDLDDYIEQDITVDPVLPLQDNYFDFVVLPANFQLIQRPLEMFREINRVLKPGGTCVVGLKLAFWSFLGVKQCRYYAETNYLEDAYALASFFHYSGGFNKARAFDLTLPETNPVGRLKDVLWPNPRMDFYACVQARKRKDSPHGRGGEAVVDEADGAPKETGLRYKPKVTLNTGTKKPSLSPYF